MSPTFIRSRIVVKEDEPVCQALVDRDIRTLYATGDFDNIQVSAETLAGGTILRYVVQERPLVTDLQCTGNKRIGSPEMLPKLASKTGERIDERKLFFDSLAIQSLYEQAGFRTPAVKHVLSLDPETGRGRVTFEISEGSN